MAEIDAVSAKGEENETPLWKIVKAVSKLQSNFDQGFASLLTLGMSAQQYTQQVSEGILWLIKMTSTSLWELLEALKVYFKHPPGSEWKSLKIFSSSSSRS